MKIGLLNLPLDNNYGGNLQRYALVKSLEGLGHDVIFLLCCSKIQEISILVLLLRYIKRIVKKICIDRNTEIFVEKKNRKRKQQNDATALHFVCKNMKYSQAIFCKQDLSKYVNEHRFDALLVGSDQVWRKTIAHEYGLGTYFFDFIDKNADVKKVAFAASLGSDTNELTKEESNRIMTFYSQFTSTSVREMSSLDLLKLYGWEKPKAEVLLDPTFLLSKEDYIKLRMSEHTNPSMGNLFCYILDKTEEKIRIIDEEKRKRSLQPFYVSIDNTQDITICQWLRSFEEATFVVTDSFHGVVFSIIFNKPFRLVRNEFRGNARFDSLFSILDIDSETDKLNWNEINARIAFQRKKAIHFLNNALKED